jgi:hypothetical protein
MNEKPILLTVDIMQRIFTIVLALALGEAFKQFVADKAEKPEDRVIHWDRSLALVAFLLLLIPFYQGMGQYFYQVYLIPEQRPTPYSIYLLVDCVVFTTEAGLLFVMSRALSSIQWRRFYASVLIILIIDTLWGGFVWLTHHQAILWWLILNVVFMIVFVAILWRCAKKGSRWGPILGLAAMIVRTVADYWTSWHLYFPS